MSLLIPGYMEGPYIPASLSEIHDLLAVLISDAPTFVDRLGLNPEQNIDVCFVQLTEGLRIVRNKLGEERYTKTMDIAARAKTLFLADPDETNGKTMEGVALLYEIEDIVQSTRKRRALTKQRDDEGEVTGD